MTTPTTPATSTLSSTEQAAVTALMQTLQSQGVNDEATALAYATQWAPDAARWGSQLAVAKSNGDTATAATMEANLKFLADGAILQAAQDGVLAQSAAESTIQTALTTLAKFAGALAVGALATA